MTAAQFEDLTPNEAENLLRWRLRRLLDAGADPAGGLLLAAQVDIGLEPAIELLSQGCPAQLALRILL
jgi:hypothetical protein